MTRPPLIKTDMSGSPSSVLVRLLPAFGDGDFRLLPVVAGDVHLLLLEYRDRRLREVGAVRALRRLRNHLELLRDLRGAVEVRGVHDPGAALVRPDQRVD